MSHIFPYFFSCSLCRAKSCDATHTKNKIIKYDYEKSNTKQKAIRWHRRRYRSSNSTVEENKNLIFKWWFVSLVANRPTYAFRVKMRAADRERERKRRFRCIRNEVHLSVHFSTSALRLDLALALKNSRSEEEKKILLMRTRNISFFFLSSCVVVNYLLNSIWLSFCVKKRENATHLAMASEAKSNGI